MAGTNRVWHIEQNGINPVPEEDRTSSLPDVFWIWFAANLAVVNVVLGAVVMQFGLSLGEGIVVSILGLASFALVGYFGIPGARTGVPTLALARSAFGAYGNVLPALLSWLNLVGWEIVALVTATYALAEAFQVAFGLAPSLLITAVAFLIVLLVSFLVALLGHATIARVQTIASYVFGAGTLVVFLVLLRRVDFAWLWHAKGAPLWTGVLPAFSVVVAGTGLSWVTTAADYTRYLPRKTSGGHIVLATSLGAFFSAFMLLFLGMVLSASLPSLANTGNPTALIGKLLPSWLSVPYLVTAAAGMVTGDIMDIYSAGLSLLAANIRIPRYRTVWVDAVLSLVGSWYILFVAQNFVGPFVAFLTVLAGILAPWAGVFLIEAYRRHAREGQPERQPERESPYGAWHWPGCLAFLVGVGVSLLFTSSPFFNGPLAKGVFAGSSLGFLLGFLVSLGLTALLPAAARAL